MNKKLIIPTVVLAIGLFRAGGDCFADQTQISATAQALVAPEGQFAPEITAGDQTIREGETKEFDVSATDANAPDQVHIEITQGQPPWLDVLSNTDGNPATMRLRAQPPVGAIGRVKVSLKAADDSIYEMSATKDIYLIVNPANNPPVITVDNQVIQAGKLLTFTLNCQDADGSDTVTLSYTGKPAWLSAAPSDNPSAGNPINITFAGTPQTTDIGEYTMDFNANDDGSPVRNATKQITIKVTRVNNPPALEPIRDKESPIRVKLEFTLMASDPQNDALTYSASGMPFSIGAAFNPATGTFSWTPTNGQAGQYSVHFEVSDGELTDSEDITIYITANDPPVFDPFPHYGKGFYKIRAGKILEFAVTAKDPNNERVTYGSGSLPAGASFNPSTQTFTWAPAVGQEGAYEATLTASDGTYTTNAIVKIIVIPVTAPIMTPVDDMRVVALRTLSYKLTAEDPDTPASQLIYAVSNNPSGSVLAGDTFTWTPIASQAGAYQDVVFSVSDGSYTDTSACWIFAAPPTAPIIEPITEKHIVEGRTLTFTINATDPNGDALTYLPPTNAPKGSYFDTASHTFTWTPVIGEAGVYKDIIFRVSDGVNTTEANVWIYVHANDAPVVEPLFEQRIKALKTLSFSVNAYDPNGDNLTYKALNLPGGAEFTDRTFKWTPALAQVGVYRDVMFEVSDGVNAVTTGVWIFVDEPGAPVIERVGDQYVTASAALTFTINATDPDEDPLTYSAGNLPDGAAFDTTTRAFTWTPRLDQVGTYPNVLFYATDGVFTATENIWILVRGPGAPSIELPGDKRVRAGSLLEFSVNATDPNTPPAGLTYSASNLPPGATFESQVFRWTPTDKQVGTYPDVRFTVSDGAYTDSNVIWIFVTAPGSPAFAQDITTKDARINEPLTFSIPPADDPDNADTQLSYYGVNLPSGATFTDKTFRWTPTTEQAGTYKNIRLEVRDPDNNIDSDIFWIIVSGNTPPVLDFIGTKYGTAGQSLTFIVSASDYDNDTLTYSAGNLPGSATFNAATRTFTWASPAAGTYTGVHLEVSDGRSTDSEDITIIIE